MVTLQWGLCFRMSLEAALAGWGADCLLVAEGKGRRMELKERTWKAQHSIFMSEEVSASKALLCTLFLLAVALKASSLKYLFSARRYKKYVFLDPLAGAVTKTHVALETETEEKLFDAPLSITKRGQLDQQVRSSCLHFRGLCSAV